MIQRNAISSTTQPIELQKIKIRNQNSLLAILFILGMTLLLSLYVYQAAAIFQMRTTFETKQQEFARTERLKAEALTFYAQTRSMETMTHRAERSGFGPPEADQFQYVKVNQTLTIRVPENATTARQ